MSKKHIRLFVIETSGASLAEFALVVPVFFALIFAVIHLSFITWGMTAMHWACETAARCAAINVPLGTNGATCTNNSTTQTYAASVYKGPNMGVVFTSDIANTACNGKKVSATGTYDMNIVFTDVPFNVAAQACYH